MICTQQTASINRSYSGPRGVDAASRASSEGLYCPSPMAYAHSSVFSSLSVI